MLRALLPLLAGLTALLALPAGAAAEPLPRCWNPETWGRPGLERPYEMPCWHVTAVALASAPAHAQVTDVRLDGQYVRWRLRPDADAPAEDTFELRLTGSGGMITQRVDVHVVPTAVNSPPSCAPITDARRSDGATPVVFPFQITCWDWERDGMRVEGGGPGSHLDSPGTIVGGHTGTASILWRYRTAVTAGSESATYWATDDLGARSADAPISVSVGPAVDRLPACLPNPAIGPGPPWRISARPGAGRNFAIHCEDPDFDPIATRIGTAPQRGAFTTFAPGPLLDWYGGSEQWVDVTYTPTSDAPLEDPFTVVAETVPARGSETAMAIAPVPLPANGGGGCGWSEPVIAPGTSGIIALQCDDAEGDPLHAAIVRPPEHGTAAPPAVRPVPFGLQEIVVAYTPAPGFTGTDEIRLAIGDGHGEPREIDVAAYVRDAPVFPPFPMPPAPVPWAPGSGWPQPAQPPAVAPAELARRALGVRKVRLLDRAGVARVYAPAAVARRGVADVPGRRALAVTCDIVCRLDARLRPARGRARTLRATAAPGRAARLAIPRRLARRAAGRRLGVTVGVRVAGRPTRTARIALTAGRG